jgi:hypothetical protein
MWLSFALITRLTPRLIDDVSTGKKQRDFTAGKTEGIDAIKGAELMRDFDEFAIIRDDLGMNVTVPRSTPSIMSISNLFVARFEILCVI